MAMQKLISRSLNDSFDDVFERFVKRLVKARCRCQYAVGRGVKWRTVQRGDNAAGLLHEQSTGHPVVHIRAGLDIGVQAPRSHVGQLVSNRFPDVPSSAMWLVGRKPAGRLDFRLMKCGKP
jgi:hypothetical protein